MARVAYIPSLLALAVVAMAGDVVAQPADSAAAVAEAAAAGSLLRGAPDRRRAPLEDLDGLEPAVDASVRGTAAAAAPAAPRAPEPPAAGRSPVAGGPRVMDTLDLGTTSITGNQELPKVLYIVPWKRSDLGDLGGRPVNTLLDEVLAPIDRPVFERHLSYYDMLYGTAKQEE